MKDLKALSEYIIKEAQKNGADEVDVLLVNSTRASIEVRLGEIEKLTQANPKSLGIRVFKNKKKAITYTSDFRLETLKDFIARTVELADVTSADEFSGLPDKDLLGMAKVNLPLFDKEMEKIPTGKKIEMAKKLEKIGMAQDKRITNSDGSSWSDSRNKYVLANSKGFFGEQEYTSCSLSLSLMGEEDDVKQTDYWWTSSRFFDKLDSIEEVAKTAAHRTVRKLGAIKPKTQNVPVVYDPQVSRDFLNIIAATVVGSAIYRKQSFLLDKLNEKIAVDNFTIIDDGILKDGLGSRLFDDEGLPSRTNMVIENGVLKTYLCDCYSARKLDMKPTASATRGVSSNPTPGASNFYLKNGNLPPEEIIASVKNGLYLTSVHWTGINYITGDYSRGAEGIWIEDGKLTYPVQEFTLAGNVLDMMKNITMIGNDLKFRSSTNAPTFKLKEMTISGS